MPLIITPTQQEEIIRHPQTKKRYTQTKKILVWETYENEEIFIWHPFLAEMIGVKQSNSHVFGMDFSGIVSVPNAIYNSGKTIWKTDRNYDFNLLNINNFNTILGGIYEQYSNDKDGDTFINHYTHFCHSIAFCIAENLIKELRLVEEVTYYEEPVFILRNDIVKRILRVGDDSLYNYTLFKQDLHGYFDGEMENIEMFEVNEFS